MYCIIIIARYPKYFGWAGLLSMMLFRFPLFKNKKIAFWKLLGSGKNGTFDKHPDWRQWAILMTINKTVVENWHLKNNENQENIINKISAFISFYLKIFHCETCALLLEPIEGFGKWNGKECFGLLPRKTDYEGRICVLTRATIYLNKLNSFWKNVPATGAETFAAKGLEATIGIGEIPFIKQATFSIWENKIAMKQFAFQSKNHAEVIRKTRSENWYKEEMFVRFKLISSFGSLNGKKYF